jgi:hypothetical protein|tara:strand:+ start:178 stop:462 length:285 start_codon:yes stop_codon:yes gene_type:complete
MSNFTIKGVYYVTKGSLATGVTVHIDDERDYPIGAVEVCEPSSTIIINYYEDDDILGNSFESKDLFDMYSRANSDHHAVLEALATFLAATHPLS